MKNSSDTIGNRTRDLPACSTEPQPTAPPRAPFRKILLPSSSGSKYTLIMLDPEDDGSIISRKADSQFKQQQRRCKIPQTFIFFFSGRQLPVGYGVLIIESSRSPSDTKCSAGILWTSDQPVAET
jgi:hypothetical protein